MTNNEQKKKFALRKRRAISPILAVVILIGITVVAGGIVFSIFSSSANVASTTDVIAIQNAQSVKGTGHADITMTVKNAGSQPWTEISMTVSKTELSEPIIYESLHENVQGCKGAFILADAKCEGDGNGGNEGEPAKGRDNPLRAQWLISLDKNSGTDGVVDLGEGASVGRKLVFQSKDDLRDIQILNGTSVAPLFGGKDQNGNDSLPASSTIDPSKACSVGSSYTDCSDAFNALDSSTKGEIFCKKATDLGNVFATCKVFTHTNIRDNPIGTGQSVYFYADAFTQEIEGLNNQVVRVGDNIVANVAAENVDGGTSRVQTIIKVTGV